MDCPTPSTLWKIEETGRCKECSGLHWAMPLLKKKGVNRTLHVGVWGITVPFQHSAPHYYKPCLCYTILGKRSRFQVFCLFVIVLSPHPRFTVIHSNCKDVFLGKPCSWLLFKVQAYCQRPNDGNPTHVYGCSQLDPSIMMQFN